MNGTVTLIGAKSGEEATTASMLELETGKTGWTPAFEIENFPDVNKTRWPTNSFNFNCNR